MRVQPGSGLACSSKPETGVYTGPPEIGTRSIAPMGSQALRGAQKWARSPIAAGPVCPGSGGRIRTYGPLGCESNGTRPSLSLGPAASCVARADRP